MRLTARRGTGVWIWGVWVVGFGLMTIGCGPSGTPVAVHPVSGRLMLANGKPLGGGTVCFESVASPGLTSRGRVQADGTFTLKTSGGVEGAAEGENLVFVVPENGDIKSLPGLPVECTDAESTTVRVTVKAGANQLEPIVLARRVVSRPTRE